MSEKSLERKSWKALYLAAEQFKNHQPWNDIPSDKLFGVVNPNTGETGYCSIMGQCGNCFALAVHRGSEGLYRLKLMEKEVSTPLGWHPMECQKCLVVSFEEKKAIEEQDLKMIHALGFTFQGKTGWPLFYRQDPAQFTERLFSEDRAFLTLALQQAVEVVKQHRQSPTLLDRKSNAIAEPYFTRVKTPFGWETKWEKPEPYYCKPPSPPHRILIEKIQSDRIPQWGAWSTDFVLMHQIQKRERIYMPYLFAIFGESHVMEMEHIHDPEEEVPDLFLTCCSEQNQIPERLIITSVRLHNIVSAIANIFDIKLTIEKQSERMTQFFDGLIDCMC